MHFVYSIVAYVAFSSCLRREDQFVVVVYFPRGARGLAVVMVNDPFSDLFFGSEKSVLSEKNAPRDKLLSFFVAIVLQQNKKSYLKGLKWDLNISEITLMVKVHGDTILARCLNVKI